MMTLEELEKLGTKLQTSVFPNIVREYLQNLFLAALYALPEAHRLLFKGGTALRIVYGSPRFSEDLDFSLCKVSESQTKSYVEALFVHVLSKIEREGIDVEIGGKSAATRGGYFGIASFQVLDYRDVNVSINVSCRNSRNSRGEVDSVAGDFVPTYTMIHLRQNELVEEKIFGALQERKKPRDFYDLYFMMRKGMLAPDQKRRLAKIKEGILKDASKIDFRRELGLFLPVDHQPMIRDFVRALQAEMERQTA
jgi:predicted nucleotidyltransferase component of viral defense system